MIRYFFYCFFVIFAVQFCSDPSGPADPDPPGPLKMVDKITMKNAIEVLSDTTLYEAGIDAVDGLSDAIAVVWHPYQGTNKISRFKIYRTSDPSGEKNFNLRAEIDVENNFDQDTSFTDNNVNLYTDYYYFVTVVDEDNQESFPSDTVKYQLIDKAEVSDLGFTYNPVDTIALQFDIPTTANAGGFILRIERTIGLTTRELVYIDYVEDFFESGTIFWELPTEKLQNLSRSIEYRWRIDLVAGNILSEGSESNWAYFTIDWGN